VVRKRGQDEVVLVEGAPGEAVEPGNVEVGLRDSSNEISGQVGRVGGFGELTKWVDQPGTDPLRRAELVEQL